MNTEISVVLCTYNPDPNIRKVIRSLEKQTLEKSKWELVLVDNNSSKSLAEATGEIGILNHRIVREPTQGLSHARKRGIHEARSDLICFIDDDNVLDPDYLEMALEIARECPFLGAWGGEIACQYEVQPDPALKKYLPLLALHPVPKDLWANFRQGYCLPRGAGMIARKNVCLAYLKKVGNCFLRSGLGRSGNQLTSCEDTDLCWSSFDLNLGIGVFQKLRLTHLIPAVRVTRRYLLKLHEGMCYSWTILSYLHEGAEIIQPRTISGVIADLSRWLVMSFTEKQFYLAGLKGRRRAVKLLRNHVS